MEGLAVLTQALADRRFPALRSIDLTYVWTPNTVATAWPVQSLSHRVAWVANVGIYVLWKSPCT